jgi:Flp pilus assembly protein TadD
VAAVVAGVVTVIEEERRVSIGDLVATAVQLHGAGRFREAEAIYRQVLAQKPAPPERPGVLTSLGNTLKAQRRFDEAVAMHLEALGQNQEFVEAWSNLGLTYQAKGLLNEAVTCIEQAVKRRPDDAGLQHNLGNALGLRGDFADAAAVCARAVQLAPAHIPAHITWATACKELGRSDEALAILDRALQIAPHNPDLHWNRGLTLLLEGDWAQGWQEIECRAQIPGLDSAFRDRREPLWQGVTDGHHDVGRTVTLVAEQGLGDTFQFIRYAPLVARTGAHVRLQAPAKLARVIGAGTGIEVVPAEAPAPPADAFAPLFSLPRLCGPAPDGIVAPPRYLSAEPEVSESWARRLGPRTGLRVGLAWQGNPQYRADARRSVPLRQWQPVLQVPGVELISLQKGFGAEQLASLPAGVRVRDLGRDLDNGPDAFVDTAGALMHIDLLITTDTALPHLAAALGCEVWLLLPAVPDWRWGRRGDRTPWYPSMKLWRQRHAGDWAEVMARVAHGLATRAASAPALSTASGGSL